MADLSDPDFDNRRPVYRHLADVYGVLPVADAAQEIVEIVRRAANRDPEAAARLFLHCSMKEWEAAHGLASFTTWLREMADQVDSSVEELDGRTAN